MTNESMNPNLESARPTRETVLNRTPVDSVLLRSLRGSWKPAAIGAYIGALSASLGNREKPKYGAVMVSSLLGAAVGLTSSMAWGTPPTAGDTAHSTSKSTSRARDAHWRHSDYT
jgi:hypothetical protein